MRVKRIATAGTLESNDILIIVAPNDEGKIEIQLESIVLKQFGEEIKKVIMDKLQELQVTSIKLKAQDRGALNYAIRARVEAAIKRSED